MSPGAEPATSPRRPASSTTRDVYLSSAPRSGPADVQPADPWPLAVDQIPALNPRYTTPESRARTVVVLGASSPKEATAPYEPLAAELARAVVSGGGNVVTGCGSKAIMGAAFAAARDAAMARGAGENLTIIKQPLWGDEDLRGGRAIGLAASEEARVEKFMAVAATFVVFPGGSGSLIELAKLVFSLAYPPKDTPVPERVVVVGGASYWAGLRAQLDTMTAAGQLKPEVLQRFAFVDDRAGLLAAVARR